MGSLPVLKALKTLTTTKIYIHNIRPLDTETTKSSEPHHGSPDHAHEERHQLKAMHGNQESSRNLHVRKLLF